MGIKKLWGLGADVDVAYHVDIWAEDMHSSFS